MHEKDAYYFSHDYNASNDPKISQMISVYGFEGYGWFWRLVEMMAEEPSGELPLEGKYISNVYSTKLHTTPDRAMKFIHDCISEFKGNDGHGLFRKRGSFFYSASLKRRMAKWFAIKKVRSKAGKLGAQKRWNTPKRVEKKGVTVIAKSKQMPHGKMGKERKGKERKGKERKEEERKGEKDNRSVNSIELTGHSPVSTTKELLEQDWVLRLHDGEFEQFKKEVQLLIPSWRPTLKDFDADLRKLVYAPWGKRSDDKKVQLLYGLLNVTKQKFNWPQVILLAVRMCNGADEPYKLIQHFLNHPNKMVNYATGQ